MAVFARLFCVFALAAFAVIPFGPVIELFDRSIPLAEAASGIEAMIAGDLLGKVVLTP